MAVFVFTGCAPPVGYVGGTADEQLLAVPYRIVYNVNNLFQRHSDLSVFTSSKGALRPIPIENITISVIENPAYPDIIIQIPDDEDYSLEYSGRKIIVLSYNGLEARYSIEVQDPLGIGGSGSGEGGNVEIGGGGGGIIWVYPGKT